MPKQSKRKQKQLELDNAVRKIVSNKAQELAEELVEFRLRKKENKDYQKDTYGNIRWQWRGYCGGF